MGSCFSSGDIKSLHLPGLEQRIVFPIHRWRSLSTPDFVPKHGHDVSVITRCAACKKKWPLPKDFKCCDRMSLQYGKLEIHLPCRAFKVPLSDERPSRFMKWHIIIAYRVTTEHVEIIIDEPGREHSTNKPALGLIRFPRSSLEEGNDFEELYNLVKTRRNVTTRLENEM